MVKRPPRDAVPVIRIGETGLPSKDCIFTETQGLPLLLEQWPYKVATVTRGSLDAFKHTG